MHLQRTIKVEVTWSQDRVVWLLYETLPYKIVQQGCHLLGFVGVLAPSDFHLCGPLKNHLHGHRCQCDAEVPEDVTVVLFTKPRILC